MRFFSNFHVKKIFHFGFGSIVAVVVSYLSMYIINSTLSRAQMGEYAHLFNILNISVPLVSLSLYSAYLRFMPICNKFDLEVFVKTRLKASFLVFSLLIYFYTGSVLIVSFAFILLVQERLYFFRSTLHIRNYNVLNISQKVIYLSVLVVFYFNYKLNAEIVFSLLGLSYFLSYLLSFFLNKYSDGEFLSSNNVQFNVVYKFCLMISMVSIINWILGISDQFMIEYYYGKEQLAPYAVTFRIVSLLGLFSGIFLSYYPTMYYRDVELGITSNVLLIRKVFVIGFIFVSLSMIVLGDSLYVIFGASEYIQEIEYFYWLILGEFFRIIASINMTYRSFKLQQHYSIIILTATAVINVVFNFLYMEEFGSIVACYSTLFSYLFYYLVSFLFSFMPEKKYFKEISKSKVSAL
ncbi:MAG: O-antigen/teichoic acid export membrane protein [Oleispira sp.]|jgi:O-antigen/teichoic acid export membrane protein